MAKRFSVEAVFKAVDRMTAPIAMMGKKMRRFTRGIQMDVKTVNNSFAKLTTTLKTVGRSLALVSVIGGGLGGNVLAAGVDFDQAMANIQAATIRTADQMVLLRTEAKRLGKTTRFTALESANAMEVLSRAGLNVNQTLAATPGILAAAAASGEDLAEVTTHVAAVLKGMNLEASGAARVADVLALAASRTKSTIGSLADALSKVSTTAVNVGVSLEEATAAVALLQDVGLDASIAGTAVNTMLNKMASPSKAMTLKMKALGVSFKDADGDMLGLTDVLAQLSKGAKGSVGNLERIAFFVDLVGMRGMQAASSLTRLFDQGRVSGLTAELMLAEGVAGRMAKIRMDTVFGSWLLLKSAVDGVKISVFELNKGPLKETIDSMTEWVGLNGELIANSLGKYLAFLIENAKKFAGLAKQAIGLVIIYLGVVAVLKVVALTLTIVTLTLGLMKIAIGAVTIAWGAFKFLMLALPKALAFARMAILALNLAMFANPVGLIIAGVSILIGLGALLLLAWDPVKDFFVGLWDDMLSIFGKIETFAKRFGSMFGLVAKAEFDAVSGAAPVSSGATATEPQVSSPQERIARSVEEKITKHESRLVIEDETRRAKLYASAGAQGISMLNSGAF